VGEVLRRVIGVKGLVVRGARLERRGVVVEVRPRQRRPRCSECGRPGPGYDTHGARVERVPWAAHDSAFSFEFEEMTAWLAQQMNKTATSKLMGINWPWNLTQRQGEKLSEVARTNKRLYRAYLLKESLALGLDYRQPWRARQHLKSWAQWASHSKLKPFVKLSNTVRNFKEGILAYVSTGLSNGLVEGLNNKIRLLTRRAFGFHSAEALAAMIYLCCGGIELTPPLPVLA
jgi:transposase